MYCILCLLQFQIQLAEHEHELIEMNSNSEKLRVTYNELLEFKLVLQKVNFLVNFFSYYTYLCVRDQFLHLFFFLIFTAQSHVSVLLYFPPYPKCFVIFSYSSGWLISAKPLSICYMCIFYQVHIKAIVKN